MRKEYMDICKKYNELVKEINEKNEVIKRCSDPAIFTYKIFNTKEVKEIKCCEDVYVLKNKC